MDGLHSCFGEEGADARFGTYLTHSKQDTKYNASHVFFSFSKLVLQSILAAFWFH